MLTNQRTTSLLSLLSHRVRVLEAQSQSNNNKQHSKNMSVLGFSLAPQLRASRGLYKAIKPIADAYANLTGYRAHGLKYDDILIEENATVTKALGRLTERESYDRVFRLRTASMCAIAHKELPKDKWVPASEDVRYLKPIVTEIEAENAERKAWDHVTKA